MSDSRYIHGGHDSEILGQPSLLTLLATTLAILFNLLDITLVLDKAIGSEGMSYVLHETFIAEAEGLRYGTHSFASKYSVYCTGKRWWMKIQRYMDWCDLGTLFAN